LRKDNENPQQQQTVFFSGLKDFTECKFAVDFDLCNLTEPIKKPADSEWSQINNLWSGSWESEPCACADRCRI